MTVSFDIQRRIYEILSQGLGIPVYDYVTPGATMPYAEIGDDLLTDLSDKTGDLWSIVYTIHLWSAARGRKEVRNLTMKTRDLLHNVDLGVPGSSLILRCQQIQTFRDADGTTAHGVVTMRCLASRQ